MRAPTARAIIATGGVRRTNCGGTFSVVRDRINLADANCNSNNRSFNFDSKHAIVHNCSENALIVISNVPVGLGGCGSLSKVPIRVVRGMRVVGKTTKALCNDRTVNNIIGVVAGGPKRTGRKVSLGKAIKGCCGSFNMACTNSHLLIDLSGRCSSSCAHTGSFPHKSDVS